ncbi:thiol-disulfide oxidoreductase DCC family protein [Prauserella cavernicola]|uniref:DUF393 domain-containing protein n=1 Tax=Prauserella cavernicola TaxID=2800127 RepID=A0A934V7H5_9PSEU|nr:DUF393 domain-containing protein [Prauserella cavernicola]MBK1787255.1 DUF393 domain-containing protein [Prauserella cavernicola]
MADTTPEDGRLLFDGDCGFCTKSISWLDARSMLGYQAMPWQSVPDDELPASVERLTTEVVLELPDGRVLGGADALAASVRASRSRLRLLGVVVAAPGLRQLARVVYRVIARNRYRMPGSSDACRIG